MVSSLQLCEAAYLCSHGIPVQVFALPSNVLTLKQAYQIPGVAKHLQPMVNPFLLEDGCLKADHMLTLMGVRSGDLSLYMSSITQIIKTMKTNDEVFTIRAFEAHIEALNLSQQQKQPLDLRMNLLKSLLYSAASGRMRELAGGKAVTFGNSGLTIVDFSCSTVTESDVCSLYQICLSLFLATRHSIAAAPKDKQSLNIAIDEAHKVCCPLCVTDKNRR